MKLKLKTIKVDLKKIFKTRAFLCKLSICFRESEIFLFNFKSLYLLFVNSNCFKKKVQIKFFAIFSNNNNYATTKSENIEQPLNNDENATDKEKSNFDLEEKQKINSKKKRKLLTEEEKIASKKRSRAKAKAKKFNQDWIKTEDALIREERKKERLKNEENTLLSSKLILIAKKELQIGDIGSDGSPITGFLWGEPITEKQERLAGTVIGGVLPEDEQREVDSAIEKKKKRKTQKLLARLFYKKK